MNERKSKNKEFNLEESLSVNASSSSILLYYTFSCPHCHNLNVNAKAFKSKVVLCSESGCRKMIIIKNFQDVA